MASVTSGVSLYSDVSNESSNPERSVRGNGVFLTCHFKSTGGQGVGKCANPHATGVMLIKHLTFMQQTVLNKAATVSY